MCTRERVLLDIDITTCFASPYLQLFRRGGTSLGACLEESESREKPDGSDAPEKVPFYALLVVYARDKLF